MSEVAQMEVIKKRIKGILPSIDEVVLHALLDKIENIGVQQEDLPFIEEFDLSGTANLTLIHFWLHGNQVKISKSNHI